MIVLEIPLKSLITPEGISLEKTGYITTSDIRQLMREKHVRFVIANIGEPLLWIPEKEGYNFWKNEAQSHLIEKNNTYIDNYPNGYCYFGSKWCDQVGQNVILLEKYH